MSNGLDPNAEIAKQKVRYIPLLDVPDRSDCLHQGNELFAAQDYKGAIESYSQAMAIAPSQWTYPLNRCFAYLKLEQCVNSLRCLFSPY